jgi:acyl carrier protein
MSVTGGTADDRAWDARYEELLRAHLPYATGAFVATDALADLGLDSLGVVSLLVDIEAGYGVEFPDELLTAEAFATVGSLWETLSSVVEAQAVGG